MGIFIFYLILFVVICSVSNKSKKNKIEEQKKNEAILVHTKNDGFNQNTTFNRSDVQRTQTTSASSTSNSSKGKNSTQSKTSSTTHQSVPKGSSTTAYLEEKAKQDRMEHEKERMESARRDKQKYGGHLTALRYMLGDPIPSGHKLFKCPYCGAENVVKMNYIGDRDCYFCRTHLI